jgi:predicted transcriptional regulator
VRDTSIEAYRSIYLHLPRLEAVVYHAILGGWWRGRIGRTCDEVEQVTKLKHQTASARIRGLVQKGFIETSGRKRPTRSGREAHVWQPVEP